MSSILLDPISLYCILYFWSFLWNRNWIPRRIFLLHTKSRAIKNSEIFPFALYLGEKLLPSDKYVMTEYQLNEYSWQMNLTVNSLEKRDFGGYVCSSVNALGKYDGVVRLQGTENFLTLFKIVFCRFLFFSRMVYSWFKTSASYDVWQYLKIIFGMQYLCNFHVWY